MKLRVFVASWFISLSIKELLKFNNDTSTMLNNILNVQVSDTTEDDSSNAAQYITINFILKNYL